MTQAAAVPPTKADALYLAQDCKADLDRLRGMPYDLEYIAPQEILLIVHLASVYDVDWSKGLEATDDDELTQSFVFTHGDGPRQTSVVRRVRMREEVLVQDLQGTLVPDGDILWAMDVLGRLRSAVREHLLAYSLGGA